MPDDETDYIGEALAASPPPRPVPPERMREPGTSPTFCIVAGVLTVIVGMLVSLGGSGFAVVGAILATIGSVLALVGVVAAGVRLGIEWSDYDRASRGR